MDVTLVLKPSYVRVFILFDAEVHERQQLNLVCSKETGGVLDLGES